MSRRISTKTLPAPMSDIPPFGEVAFRMADGDRVKALKINQELARFVHRMAIQDSIYTDVDKFAEVLEPITQASAFEIQAVLDPLDELACEQIA